MKKVKVGVIGVGRLGQHHARLYAENPKCDLIGVVDVDNKAATRIAKLYKTQSFFDYKYIIDKVDAVSIAVPTILHYEIGKAFIEKGIHVLIEKPITQTVDEAHELIRIAKEKKVILQVGHIERFNPAIRKLKKIVKTPRFIESHRLGPFDARVKDIGVVLDLMIHDIDIILYIVKSPIREIEALGVPIITDKEDIANARIRFENGCIANIVVSRVTPKEMRKIRIFQQDAYISIDYRRQGMELYEKVPFANPRKGEPLAKIVRKKVRLKSREPLRGELEHFISCVSRGEQPVVSGEEGRNALEIAVKISEEIRSQIERHKAK